MIKIEANDEKTIVEIKGQGYTLCNEFEALLHECKENIELLTIFSVALDHAMKDLVNEKN
mgnify:CR=1 FL=1